MAWMMRKPGSRTWIVRWREGNKPRERSTKTANRSAALAIKAEIERTIALRKAGLLSESDERRSDASKKPIDAHLDDFGRTLRAKGATARHVVETLRRARAVLDVARVSRFAEIIPSRIQAALAERRDSHSDRGANKDLVALRSFLRWAMRDGRIAEDPIASIRRFRVVSAPHRKRRALSEQECEALIAQAAAGPVYRGLSGPDRAMLYRLAIGTGFRVSELASLTPESFALDAALIVVRAAHSKDRKEHAQPVRADLVEHLRPWLASRSYRARVFPVLNLSTKTAEMIRFDAAGAGIRIADERGEVDFHALRHTYVSAIVAGGASPKVAQTLARHSDPKLTIGIYSHVESTSLARALDGLPRLSGPIGEAVAATGTDGSHAKRHASNADSSGVLRTGADSQEKNENLQTDPKQENVVRKGSVLAEEKVVAGLGFEPRLAESESNQRKRKTLRRLDLGRARNRATQSTTLSLVDLAHELNSVPAEDRPSAIRAALKAIRAAKGGA